jgi:hypothetical protein
MFAAMDEDEELLYGAFLNSGARDAEMPNTEYADFNWKKCTLHVQPKPWRDFPSKARRKRNPQTTGSFRSLRSWFGRSKIGCESGMILPRTASVASEPCCIPRGMTPTREAQIK